MVQRNVLQNEVWTKIEERLPLYWMQQLFCQSIDIWIWKNWMKNGSLSSGLVEGGGRSTFLNSLNIVEGSDIGL